MKHTSFSLFRSLYLILPMSPASSATAPPVKPPLPPEIEDLHASAVAQGQETYTDPATGYMVMTALYHRYIDEHGDSLPFFSSLSLMFGGQNLIFHHARA